MTPGGIPELEALDSGSAGVRIPPGDTAPLTPRVRAILDTAALRRLQTRVDGARVDERHQPELR
ncbi:MAG: hypothetical protein ACKON8_01805, partial [Planctomycetota bacterium]